MENATRAVYRTRERSARSGAMRALQERGRQIMAGTAIRSTGPGSESFVFKGHMHFWAEPEIFNAALDDFLSRLE
jgi:hypothetical protein